MKRIKDILFLFIILFSLSGCIQTTALMGPGVTIVTSGNVAQAGFQYGTNKAIEKKTGKDTLSLIKDTISENLDKDENSNSKSSNKEKSIVDYDESSFHKNFIKLVKKNFYETRSRISYN